MTIRITEQQYKLFGKLARTKPAPKERKRYYKREEAKIRQACIEWLEFHGCEVIKNNSGSVPQEYTDRQGNKRTYRINFGKKGSGDILACSPKGRWIEVETKTEDGVQGEEQKDRQRRIEARNGVYVLARGVEELERRKADILG